jgi:NTE family protein
MEQKRINLALQGGGAHGAFTWGVLDRLLEEERIHIEGISGTSAGAMNGAFLAHGFHQNGAQGAKKALLDFWQAISQLGKVLIPTTHRHGEYWEEGWNLDWSLSYNYFDLSTRLVSPYQINPLNLNPLRTVLETTLDIQSLQSCQAIKLFVAATNVRTGQPRVFKRNEVTIDVLLASACIPHIFQAIEIDGEAYWDGGYMGNPVIWPLIYHTQTSDVVLVQINPIYRKEIPHTAHEIINRLNEITFNSSLISEMRAISFVSRLMDKGLLHENGYKDMKIHVIKALKDMEHLNASSKLNTSWEFFTHLKEIGRHAADQWLKQHFRHIGERSTINIQEEFLRK